MARIRTIKPSFFSDDALRECSHSARLLFIGLWVFGDDMGRMIYSPRAIQTYIFANEPAATCAQIAAWVAELEGCYLIERYKVGGHEYLRVPGFVRHQRIDDRSHSKLPKSPREHGPACLCKRCKTGELPKRANVFHVKPQRFGGAKVIITLPEGVAATDDPEAQENQSDAAEEPAEATGHDFTGEPDIPGLTAENRDARRRAIEVFAARMLETLGLPDGQALLESVIAAIRSKSISQGITLEAAGNAVFGPAALMKANGKAPDSWVQFFRAMGA